MGVWPNTLTHPMKLIIQIPCLNEEQGIRRVLESMPDFVDEVIVVDNNSTDSTRAIVERIAQSNVIVYVTCEQFKTAMISGRTMWADASGEARYLRVQVDCMLPRATLVMLLGHELQHVAEVADRPDVIDSATFVKLFDTIGFPACGSSSREQFETDDATAAGRRVREEFLHR